MYVPHAPYCECEELCAPLKLAEAIDAFARGVRQTQQGTEPTLWTMGVR